MNDAEKLQALEAYFRLMSMKGVSEVFRAARESGVLVAVAGGARTAEAVAAAGSLAARPAELLLGALCAAGVVTRRGQEYHPAPVLQLLSGTYRDLSSQYWDHLPMFLKTGQPMQRMDDPAEGQQAYAAQAASLYWMMRPSAVALARMLDIGGARRNLNILDVGAGSGVWSLALLGADAGSRVTAVDWPAVLAVAGECAAQSGMQARFAARAGNYHEVSFEADAYDLAVAANIAHLESEERLTALFVRLREALKPGGLLLVVDVFHGQAGGELHAALYELGLALRTGAGRVHGAEALQQCLRKAGLAGGSYLPIPAPPHTMGVIMTQKGAE